MNDVYVTTLVLAAVLAFSPLVIAARRRPWTAVALLLATGVALGAALAAKWVALYAMGGLVLLVLLRSGFGRILALVGMIALTAVLGAMAIRPAAVADGATPNLNWAFLLLMFGLTGLLTAAIVRRPLAIGRNEAWVAVVGAIVVGVALVAVGVWRRATGPDLPLEVLASTSGARLAAAGGLAILVGVGAGALAWLAARRGRGPFAGDGNADDGTTNGWFRPGWLAGVPWLFTLGSLTLVPIVVYVVAYAPWVSLGNDWGLPLVGGLPFLPEGTEGRQTLLALTTSMYEYHDDLRASHAASSPWWAWPFDLKPVWFYQGRFDGDVTGLIYDTGNLVIFWMGVPAMAFTALMAWRRRSPALTLVVLMWAALLLPWARIDRATFQYHVYASLPFLILALAYLLAELWHGARMRVWFLARASAAIALLAIPSLWLIRQPLCLLAGTTEAHPNGSACSAISRTAQLSEADFVSLLVLALGAGLAAWLGWRLARARERGVIPSGQRGPVISLISVGATTLVAVLFVNVVLDTGPAVGFGITPEVLALAGFVVLAVPAWIVMRARDARRFVLGVLAAALLWLLVWYPNISGLPLPSGIAHAYQGLLPTWNWDFQFAVNLDPPTSGSTIDVSTLVVGLVTMAFVAGIALLVRLAGRTDGGATGSPPARADVRGGRLVSGADGGVA